MGPCRCIVSFTDPDGIVHEVQVYATTVYGAVAAAISEWEFGGIAGGKPGAMTELTVVVHRQPVTHRLLYKQVTSWAKGTGRSPQELLERKYLRRILKLDEGG